MSEFVPVAPVAELALNKGKAVVVDGVDVLVCNTGDGFVAVENRCSHQDQPLANGRIRNGYVFCPVHGMRFKLATGEAIGQLTRVPIKVFETRVEDDQLLVRVAAG